jgi:hypothetical protein
MALIPPSVTSAIAERNSQKETASESPLVIVLEKAAADAKSKHRKKDKNPASTSLEAHQALFSSSDVSIFCSSFRVCSVCPYFVLFLLQPLMQKFLSLGVECLEFRKAADENKGKCFLFFLI